MAIGIILIIAALMVARAKSRRRRYRAPKQPKLRVMSGAQYPYVLAGSLLTPCERRFYEALRPVVPDGLILTFKVRLADVLICPEAYWQQWGWRTASKHLDFLLLDSTTLTPRLAIELDDSSHDTRSRKRRDRFVDAAAGACGLSILHIRASVAYSPNELAKAIQGALRPIA